MKRTFKIEKNNHYKPDEMVLQCGEQAYYGLVDGNDEPEIEYHNVIWRVEACRKGENRTNYICVKERRVYFSRIFRNSTPFPAYSEAKEVADALLSTGNFYVVRIITEICE